MTKNLGAQASSSGETTSSSSSETTEGGTLTSKEAVRGDLRSMDNIDHQLARVSPEGNNTTYRIDVSSIAIADTTDNPVTVQAAIGYGFVQPNIEMSNPDVADCKRETASGRFEHEADATPPPVHPAESPGLSRHVDTPA